MLFVVVDIIAYSTAVLFRKFLPVPIASSKTKIFKYYEFIASKIAFISTIIKLDTAVFPVLTVP